MQLVLSDIEGNVTIVELPETTATMADIERCAAEFTSLSPDNLSILHNGSEILWKDRPSDLISSFGIEDTDMLLIKRKENNNNSTGNVLTSQDLANALAMTNAQMQQQSQSNTNSNNNMIIENSVPTTTSSSHSNTTIGNNNSSSSQPVANNASSSTSFSNSSGRLTLDDLPPNLEPAGILEFFKVNDHLMKELNFNNPPLAKAIETGKVEEVRSVMMEQQLQRFMGKYEKEQEIRQLEQDPDNPENQAKMMEMIRLEQVQKNMESAMEYMPEAFGRVVMLYINVEVDGTPIKVLVDSGAQSTIMSTRCAERCGLMRLVDRRFGGVARGVGTANIVGRIHMAPIKIGNSVYPCTFTVMEKDIEFLFGLDMLKRYQCVIDLKRNVLCMGDAGVNDVRFLDENEIPPSELEMRDDSNTNDENNGNSLPPEGLLQGSDSQDDEELQRVLAESLQDNSR